MDLSNSLYSTEQLIKPKPSHTIFILYCEFSTKRASQLFCRLRNHDRLLHFTSYPALKYLFVYILHGGYSTFYKKYPYLCEPDLLSIWHKHCKLVNRQSMNSHSQVYPDKNHNEMLNTHTHINQSTNRHIKVPFKSISNHFHKKKK